MEGVNLDSITAVVLAAGQGKRMISGLPKVMHRICGRPLLHLVFDSLKGAGISKVVAVVGYGSEHIFSYFKDQGITDGADGIEFVNQPEQLGSGHAVMVAAEAMRLAEFNGKVIVINGDMPMVKPETISALIEAHGKYNNAVTIVSADLPDPFGLGRVIRKSGSYGSLERIVEQKDASEEVLGINEVNAGVYCFDSQRLVEALGELKNDNSQGEYYLTDTIGILSSRGERAGVYKLPDYKESLGVNDRVELSRIDELMRGRICKELMLDYGVTIVDPQNTYIDLGVEIQQDTVIYPGCVIEGNTRIGSGCIIGPNTRVSDSVIEDGVKVECSVLNKAHVRRNSTVGPFAYLRPDTVVGENARIGDFVELKNSNIGDGTKIPHLSYVGDSDVGSGTNIGCGVITCNYDGRKKYRTTIGNNVFVGSNTNLIAPVSLGDGSYVASGSTVTDDVPEGALAVARGRQTNKEGWVEKRAERG